MTKNRQKPKKPYPEFPLTAHRNGQWCKKIRGKIHYFGIDADTALEKYLLLRDDLQAGRQPKLSSSGTSVRSICNSFLTRISQRSDQGELSPRTFRDYYDICRAILDCLGPETDPEQLRPDDFARFRTKVAARYAPTRWVTVHGLVLESGVF